MVLYGLYMVLYLAMNKQRTCVYIIFVLLVVILPFSKNKNSYCSKALIFIFKIYTFSYLNS